MDSRINKMNLHFSKKRIRNIAIISIIAIIYIGVVAVFLAITHSYRLNMYVNWKIFLPKPEKINLIYRYNFSKGEDFYIWDYKNINSVVESSKFEKLDKNSQEKITSTLEEHYNNINEEERKNFDKNTSIEHLKSQENYYIYKGSHDHYLLLIACPNNNRLYVFSVNY